MRIDELFSVAGKRVVITGGSRGIGEMIARGYIENGAEVIITARNAAVCDGLAGVLGERCTSIPADLSKMAEIERFADAVATKWDRVDVLFNNAGASWGATVEAFPEVGWDKVMDLNVKSVFFLTQKLLPLLKRENAVGGEMSRVINIGSIDGQQVSDLETYSYAASKAGVLHLTRMMAKYLAKDGIAVNAIAPGFFPSKMTAGVAEMVGDAIIEATPLKRWGTPEDMAGVALFLGSRASGFLCGSTVTVDGGYKSTV
ncbi:gluconate 5-dehydrogenase [Polymorphobacter multimanifer]|uniref:NAD(P)-dependent dehydrogenase (Short-subunit alcohol dehydrogenase family) n=1 Tax=Polymorphobacter multimanifer TaxID=1070431 RepID=A0A841LEN7_9SPHN|nr:SDR family oxidoreductase [Polymorphobacter multimanifer]MBB6229513.1 NAD(P)-dependent dehydrogenase (short-subunit alcohol dehydrogenase family) [Polymorphobacter multimanifer]GGI92883.1 gluconate 5-dehydrogenase [Polymorphobacter multimanifer]